MAATKTSKLTVKKKSVYTSEKQLKNGIKALKLYVKKSEAVKKGKKKRDLLSAGLEDPSSDAKVIVEIVFKLIPENRNTFIHDIVLPHHWRLQLQPEDYNIAIFVKHLKPIDEVEEIQFKRDRELDIGNTHQHYIDLFDSKLSATTRSMISKIITMKELMTDYKTYQSMDRLPKNYDLFLADKPLLSNKLNLLPRRLGRRFWVKERKMPLSVNLKAGNLQEEFDRVFQKQQFYVTGRSSTEKMQIGLLKQTTNELAENMKALLKEVHKRYGNLVRFIRLRTNGGLAIPVYADLSLKSETVKPQRPSKKLEPIVADFDMLDEDSDEGTQIQVYPDGRVNIVK